MYIIFSTHQAEVMRSEKVLVPICSRLYQKKTDSKSSRFVFLHTVLFFYTRLLLYPALRLQALSDPQLQFRQGHLR